MRRILVYSSITAFLLVSCIEEPCACVYLPPFVTVRGHVQLADSSPATSAVTWPVLYQDTTCAVPMTVGMTTPVDASAGYEHPVMGWNSRLCLAVYAAPQGTANRKDSTRATVVHTFLDTGVPDTLVMPVIRLP